MLQDDSTLGRTERSSSFQVNRIILGQNFISQNWKEALKHERKRFNFTHQQREGSPPVDTQQRRAWEASSALLDPKPIYVLGHEAATAAPEHPWWTEPGNAKRRRRVSVRWCSLWDQLCRCFRSHHQGDNRISGRKSSSSHVPPGGSWWAFTAALFPSESIENNNPTAKHKSRCKNSVNHHVGRLRTRPFI